MVELSNSDLRKGLAIECLGMKISGTTHFYKGVNLEEAGRT